jgi:hypothetical protein
MVFELAQLVVTAIATYLNHTATPARIPGAMHWLGYFQNVALLGVATGTGVLVAGCRRLHRLPANPTIRRQPVSPPLNAEFLFYLFMTPQNCDALVGDLEERFKLIHKRFGRRRANFWYWTQTVMSIWPIAWAWAKKASLKPIVAVVGWAVAKGLLGHDSWLAALVELWKRVRS